MTGTVKVAKSEKLETACYLYVPTCIHAIGAAWNACNVESGTSAAVFGLGMYDMVCMVADSY